MLLVTFQLPNCPFRDFLENPEFGPPVELRKRDRVRLFLLEKTQKMFTNFGLQSYLEHKTVEEILKKLMKVSKKNVKKVTKKITFSTPSSS